MSNKCKIESCSLTTGDNSEYCVLHCEKHDYSTDFNSSILSDFYDELIKYIVAQIFNYTSAKYNNFPDRQSVISFLKGQNASDQIKEFVKKQIIVFSGIFFPCRDDRDSYDYFKILKMIKGAHFNGCKFTATSMELKELEVFFQECIFYQGFRFIDFKVLRNMQNVIFQDCIFLKDASIYSEDLETQKIDCTLFNDCIFKKSLCFQGVSCSAPIFNNSEDSTTEINNLEINNLEINNCKISNRFILNNLKVNCLHFINSEFSSKFELKNGIIEEFFVENTNFLGLSNLFGTHFRTFSMLGCIFNDFTGYEQCKFGINNTDNNEVALFEYVTFMSFVNFRNTVFYSEFNIQNINFKETPNFLNIKLYGKKNNRETFRIIKNSFDKTGNHIEANKFFVFEMKAYKKELKEALINPEKVIFWLNEKISNFGQSYIRPIIILLIVSIIYYSLICCYNNNILYEIYPPMNHTLEMFCNLINDFAANFIPFAKLLKNGMEFVSLIFYIIFISLIWQIVVSIKRHTKR